jgi:hypothetical protein
MNVMLTTHERLFHVNESWYYVNGDNFSVLKDYIWARAAWRRPAGG